MMAKDLKANGASTDIIAKCTDMEPEAIADNEIAFSH